MTFLKPLRAGATLLMLALMTACSQEHTTSPLGGVGGSPDDHVGTTALSKSSNTNHDEPELGSCDKLQSPDGSKVAFHAYAYGVQIYRWNGTTWTFVAPEATLSASPNGNGIVGKHYAGPTWELNGGAIVTGSVIDRCTPDANAIPWLSLAATNNGHGAFSRVSFIQRVNTVGGLLPTVAGKVVGDVARVPYTAEYYFYRTN